MKETRKILSLALPAMAENVLQMLMGFVDSYLVAKLGIIAVTGVSLANNLLAIYQALFIALGVAISSLVAKAGQDKVKQKHYQSQALSMTLILSTFLGLLSFFAGKASLSLIGAEEEVVSAGVLYLEIVGGGILTLGLMTTFSAILRAQGQSNLPMYVSLLVNGLNALLSALSVFIFHFGIAGVAVATVFSRFIGVLILASFLPVRNMLSQMTWRLDRQVLNLSLPAAGERLMMRAGDFVLISFIVQLGTEVVAGNSIGETLTQFNYMPGFGFATATVILVAESSVQKRQPLIKKIYRLTSLTMLTSSLLVYLFGSSLMTLFTENSRAQEASSLVLLYSLLGSFATAGTLIYTAVWQGLGNAKLPFYATMIGMWGIRILIGYFITIPLNLGLSGIWIATVADNIWRFTYLWLAFRKTKMNS